MPFDTKLCEVEVVVGSSTSSKGSSSSSSSHRQANQWKLGNFGFLHEDVTNR